MEKNQNNGAKSRKQMADEFNMTRKTFYSKRIEYGIKIPKGLIMPKSQEIIYKAFGKPKNVP